FAESIPMLTKAWDRTPATNPLKTKLAEPIALLKEWNFRWSAQSIPTSLGQYFGDEIGRRSNDITKATDDQLLQALSAAVDKLASDFGTWKTPWGDINRYQRVNGDIVQKFNDA